MRIHRLAALIALTFAAVAVNAQIFSRGIVGNGEMGKRVFKLSEFKNVSVSSGIDIYLDPSGKNQAELVTDKNVINAVEVEQNGNNLIFKLREGVRRTTKGIKVYLSYKTLERIKASGGSDVYMNNNAVLKSKSLSIDASGGSDIRLAIDVETLSCESSGGSDIYLNGKASNASFDCSGGSDVKSKGLIVENCSVDSSGGSDVTITATKSIKIDASGASDVYYYGNPKNVSVSKSGSSDIYRR
jgi:Protein of unknown function (DUF2807).